MKRCVEAWRRCGHDAAVVMLRYTMFFPTALQCGLRVLPLSLSRDVQV